MKDFPKMIEQETLEEFLIRHHLSHGADQFGGNSVSSKIDHGEINSKLINPDVSSRELEMGKYFRYQHSWKSTLETALRDTNTPLSTLDSLQALSYGVPPNTYASKFTLLVYPQYSYEECGEKKFASALPFNNKSNCGFIIWDGQSNGDLHKALNEAATLAKKRADNGRKLFDNNNGMCVRAEHLGQRGWNQAKPGTFSNTVNIKQISEKQRAVYANTHKLSDKNKNEVEVRLPIGQDNTVFGVPLDRIRECLDERSSIDIPFSNQRESFLKKMNICFPCR